MCILTLLTFTESFSQELITSGNLETGVIAPFYGSSTISTISPHRGTYRINLGNDWRAVSQDIVTVIDTDYIVSFWYRMAKNG